MASTAQSQTVNICDRRNIHGEYDYIVRLRAPFISEDALLRQNFKSIEDLVQYLETNHFGQIECSPIRRLPASVAARAERTPISEMPLQAGEPNPILPPRCASTWEQSAQLAVETSIDQFILEFLEFPYLHLVEHSIHCELFRILTAHKIFSRTYQMGRWQSQTVHKEWPEFLARAENGNRRATSMLRCSRPSI
jgi:hypothetical protein